MSGIAVRRLITAEEMEPCHELQAVVWNMPDPTDIVPGHQLQTAAKYGGIVLGAFDRDRIVGLSYGFVGLWQDRPLLCSHLNAVLPEYRGRGIGCQLKLAQREHCLADGLGLMHWTYDPLELVNGNLNIRRLGGTSVTYVRNLYGAMQDGLNAGLPSDRLVVEWDLASARVTAAIEHGSAPGPDRADCMPYDGSSLPEGGRPLALTMPVGFQEIKRQDPAEALRWRLHVRSAFERAFAAGYRVTGADQHGYIFTKETPA